MPLSSQIDALVQQLNHPALPGIELSLDRMHALMTALGNPQEKLPPVIHVAGTNGKGSTIAFLRAMLEADGKRVHAYISPPLRRFNERIVLAGKDIDDAALLPLLQRVVTGMHEHPVTQFEAITAVAFLAFSETPGDVLLLEVGMGGRLDATNLITQPLATVITPIGLDHQEFLGPTLAAIAAEKAGIMKPGVPCISAPQEPEAWSVLQQKAAQFGAPLTVVHEPVSTHLGLEGAHQPWNAALAVETLRQVMPISERSVQKGLAQAHWPARLQHLQEGPLVEAWGEKGAVYLDGAHNAHAAAAIASWAKEQPQPILMIAGLMARKDATAFFSPFAGVLDALVCIGMPHQTDAQTALFLADAARQAGLEQVEVADDAYAALDRLQRYKAATVVIAGSLFLAGELLKTHE